MIAHLKHSYGPISGRPVSDLVLLYAKAGLQELYQERTFSLVVELSSTLARARHTRRLFHSASAVTACAFNCIYRLLSCSSSIVHV